MAKIFKMENFKNRYCIFLCIFNNTTVLTDYKKLLELIGFSSSMREKLRKIPNI